MAKVTRFYPLHKDLNAQEFSFLGDESLRRFLFRSMIVPFDLKKTFRVKSIKFRLINRFLDLIEIKNNVSFLFPTRGKL